MYVERTCFYIPTFYDSFSLVQTEVWKHLMFVGAGLLQTRREGYCLIEVVFNIYNIINTT